MRDEKGRFVKGSMSIAMLGNKHGSGNKGRKASKETRKKMGKSKIGNKNLLGFKFSEKSKKKMSITHIERDPKGDRSHSWKGGKFTSGRGYVYIFMPEHPSAHNNYVYEHRFIMEQFIDRYLEPQEIIHHINEIRDDNGIENLLLCKNLAEHRRHHRKLEVINNLN